MSYSFIIFFLSVHCLGKNFSHCYCLSNLFLCSLPSATCPKAPCFGGIYEGRIWAKLCNQPITKLSWLSVFKKKVLFTDLSDMLILTHYSPRSNILVSLMCNAKIVKHALFSSRILYIPLDANGSGQGSCCFWCAAAVCLKPWSVTSINPRPPAHYLILWTLPIFWFFPEQLSMQY